MENQTTGIPPFELMFGRNPNIPPALANSPNLTYQDLIKKWKTKHDNLSRKAKERVELEMEKTKRKNDESIVKKHPLYKLGDKIKLLNNTKQNKLDPSWKGPYEVIEQIDNNNLKIRDETKITRVYIDQCMPYFPDEDHTDLTPGTSNIHYSQL